MKRGAALLALLFASSSLALAKEEARVVLLLPACELPGAAASELRRAVALDLRAEGLSLAPAGELSPGRDVELLIEAICPAPDELTLSAQHEEERRSRSFRLSELPPEQRSRALSLALSELVSLVKSASPPADALEAPPPAAAPAPEPPAPAKPQPPRPPPPAEEATPPPDVAPVRARRPRLGLSPQARLFDGTWLWGAELWLTHSRLRYSAGLLLTRSASASGTVTTRLVHAGAGYAFPLLGSAGGSVLESGPRLGVGHTFMSVESSGGAIGRDAHDWYVDGAWVARYSGRLSKTLALGFGVELGYARGPIGYADDLVVARTSGAFASLTVEGCLSL